MKHPQFNPRAIEQMTRFFQSEGLLEKKGYVDLFVERLLNPSQMWADVLGQLTQLARDISVAL